MANGTNEGYESMHDDEVANAHLSAQVPDCDEDLEEAFIGPYGDEVDESYDDSYEAESTALIKGSQSQALQSSGGAVSGDTHSDS